VQTFSDVGCRLVSVVSVTDPYDRIHDFLDRSRYFSFKYLLSCTHEAEWTPFQTHYFSENLVARRIEPEPLIYSQELRSLAQEVNPFKN
jgi:hypothetical protein